MKQKLFYFCLGFGFASIALLITFTILLQFKEAQFAQKEEELKLTSKPWFPISEEVRKKLGKLHVTVKTKSSYSSGCKIMGGKAYLVSLHAVANEALNNEPITVDGKVAYQIFRSHTDYDYAVYSENPNLKQSEIDLKFHDKLIADQFVIVLGNPGERPNYLQPAVIERRDVIVNGTVQPHRKEFTGQYVELGGSGGCIFTQEGTELVGVVQTKSTDEKIKNTVGGMVTISAPIE